MKTSPLDLQTISHAQAVSTQSPHYPESEVPPMDLLLLWAAHTLQLTLKSGC